MSPKKKKDDTWWEEEICGNCLYFGPRGSKGKLDEINKLDEGACKYSPPIVIPNCLGEPTVRIPRIRGAYFCLQPTVKKDNWCGKWETREAGSGKVTAKVF